MTTTKLAGTGVMILAVAIGGCVSSGKYNDARTKASAAETTTQKAHADLAAAKAEVAEAKTALANATSEIGKATQSISDLNGELAKARAETLDCQKARAVDQEKFKVQWAKAEDEVDRLARKVRELTKAHQEAQDAVKAKDHTIAKLNSKVDELQKKIKRSLQVSPSR